MDASGATRRDGPGGPTKPAKPAPRELSLWDRARRYSFVKTRLTRGRLDAFAAGYASEAEALIVHSHDIDHRKHFPNGHHLTSRAKPAGDARADKHYTTLSAYETDSRDLIVCTGLLEHLPDPGRAIAEFARILRPGGRVLLSASGVFSYHGQPDNYFHFTPGAFRTLLADGFEVEAMVGSTGPFETLGVLAQRINIQCEVSPPFRVLLDAMTVILPKFDRFVVRQYGDSGRHRLADEDVGIMPATLLAVARRSAAP